MEKELLQILNPDKAADISIYLSLPPYHSCYEYAFVMGIAFEYEGENSNSHPHRRVYEFLQTETGYKLIEFKTE